MAMRLAIYNASFGTSMHASAIRMLKFQANNQDLDRTTGR